MSDKADYSAVLSFTDFLVSATANYGKIFTVTLSTIGRMIEIASLQPHQVTDAKDPISAVAQRIYYPETDRRNFTISSPKKANCMTWMIFNKHMKIMACSL